MYMKTMVVSQFEKKIVLITIIFNTIFDCMYLFYYNSINLLIYFIAFI